MKEAISKNEGLALRGLCITLIVLHNFIHVVVPYGENEKCFVSSNADFFVNHLFEHPILGFLSYLGWIGVPMFFFMSGYGLKRKYGNVVPRKFQFIVWHYLKLLLLAAPVIILSNILVKTSFFHIVGQLTFLNHIFAYEFIRPHSFWFIRTAFEFYILYAIILHRINPKILLGIGFITTCCLYFFSWSTVEMLKYYFIGWLLEFSLGVFVAQNGQYVKYIENVWASIILFALMMFTSVNGQSWLFSTSVAILFFLSIKRYITCRLIVFLGSISALLYATHTAVRNVWDYIDSSIDYMDGNLLLIFGSISGYFILCVITAVLYGKYYKKAVSFLKSKLKITDN